MSGITLCTQGVFVLAGQQMPKPCLSTYTSALSPKWEVQVTALKMELYLKGEGSISQNHRITE